MNRSPYPRQRERQHRPLGSEAGRLVTGWHQVSCTLHFAEGKSETLRGSTLPKATQPAVVEARPWGAPSPLQGHKLLPQPFTPLPKGQVPLAIVRPSWPVTIECEERGRT
jgi:hypothetical protein